MNVHGEMQGDTLVLRIDCGAPARAKAPASKSGKTRILASTKGFVRFGDVSLSVNATIPLNEA